MQARLCGAWVLAALVWCGAGVAADLHPRTATLLGVGMVARAPVGQETYDPADGALAARVIGCAREAVAAQSSGAKPTRPRFFMVPFGYQGPGNDAHDSHTFASFVRVTGARSMSWLTISWLPATFAIDLRITIWGAAVPGRDYGLRETLEFARRGAQTVACWGPYEITGALYEAAQRRVVELRSGRLTHPPNDHGKRERGEACNCMHAVVDLDGEIGTYGGLLNLGLGYWGIKVRDEGRP